MYEALPVRVGQRLRDIAQHARGLGDGQRPARRPSRAQRFPRHEQHREPGHPGGLAGGEHGHDVRMLQPRGGADLAAKAVHGRNAAVDRHDLDRDAAAEGGFGGDEHARHPAAAEFTFDGVGGTER